MLRPQADSLIDLCQVGDRSEYEVICEVTNIVRRFCQLAPVSLQEINDRRSRHVVLKKHLERAFSRFSPGTHKTLRFDSNLSKQIGHLNSRHRRLEPFVPCFDTRSIDRLLNRIGCDYPVAYGHARLP